MPEEAMKAYKTEKERLGTQSDMEQNVVERYLDWLTQIPFGVYTKDSFNVKKAREILDRDHYGLKDVKDRILEFISVGKISGMSMVRFCVWQALLVQVKLRLPNLLLRH